MCLVPMQGLGIRPHLKALAKRECRRAQTTVFCFCHGVSLPPTSSDLTFTPAPALSVTMMMARSRGPSVELLSGFAPTHKATQFGTQPPHDLQVRRWGPRQCKPGASLSPETLVLPGQCSPLGFRRAGFQGQRQANTGLSNQGFSVSCRSRKGWKF